MSPTARLGRIRRYATASVQATYGGVERIPGWRNFASWSTVAGGHGRSLRIGQLWIIVEFHTGGLSRPT